MIACVLSDLTWLPLPGGGRKSWYIIITITFFRTAECNPLRRRRTVWWGWGNLPNTGDDRCGGAEATYRTRVTSPEQNKQNNILLKLATMGVQARRGNDYWYKLNNLSIFRVQVGDLNALSIGRVKGWTVMLKVVVGEVIVNNKNCTYKYIFKWWNILPQLVIEYYTLYNTNNK